MTTKALVVLLAGLVAALGLAGPAAAGGDDSYGSTSTTEPPTGDEPSCSLNVTSGPPGTNVTATVSDVPVGQTVRILFDGEEVGRAEAQSEVVANVAGAGVLLGGIALAAGVETTTVTIDFVVPFRPPGTYIVTAVGDTFTKPCGPGEGGEFDVLAAGTDDGGGGSLPKTGIYAGLLVVVAIALLLGGRALVLESRRRRRRAARRAGRHTRAEV